MHQDCCGSVEGSNLKLREADSLFFEFILWVYSLRPELTHLLRLWGSPPSPLWQYRMASAVLTPLRSELNIGPLSGIGLHATKELVPTF